MNMNTKSISRIGSILARSSRSISQASSSWDQSHRETHIPLTNLQKLILGAGSSLISIVDPLRGDMVADLAEVSGDKALAWMRSQMLSSDEGRRVLDLKPRLNSSTINYETLREMGENTLGRHYAEFYTKYSISPDTRRLVQFVNDVELGYVMQRYRELHDIIHTLLDMPIDVPSEIAVKAFELVQTRLPMCFLACTVGPLRMNNIERLDYLTRKLPWAIKSGRDCRFLMGIHFEERFEQDIDDLRGELNLKLLQ